MTTERLHYKLPDSGQYRELQTPGLPDYGPKRAEFLETMLWNHFPELVDRVKLEDILHLYPGRKQAPRNLDAYSLVPVMTQHRDEPSLQVIKSGCTLPEGITTNYQRPGGRPNVDGAFGIGLTYYDERSDQLIAVCSAGISSVGDLRIVQIQAMTKDASGGGKAAYRSGLHGGFLWRDTLVQAWQAIARDLNVSDIEIQGAANNIWRRDPSDDPGNEPYRLKAEEENKRLKQTYDVVAERMGYIYNPQTRNWVKQDP